MRSAMVVRPNLSHRDILERNESKLKIYNDAMNDWRTYQQDHDEGEAEIVQLRDARVEHEQNVIDQIARLYDQIVQLETEKAEYIQQVDDRIKACLCPGPQDRRY